MAITIDDFSKIWASTSPLTPYAFSEDNYKQGWNFVGSTPPSRQMWDFIQKQNDEKLKYLLDNFGDYAKKTDLDDYLPLAGGTMTGAIKGNPVILTADDGNNEVSLIGKADFGLMWNNVPISLPDGTYNLDFYGFGYITSSATALDITFPYICRNKDILFNSLSAILRSYKGYLSPSGGDILTGSTQGTWYGKNTSPFPAFRLVRSGGWGTNGENNTVVVGEFSANVTVTTVV